VVGGELAISWFTVLKVEVGAISRRANSPCASIVWARNWRMSNARMFEMEAEGHADRATKNERERVARHGSGERKKVR
jgi:hypothetical protein